MNVMKKTRIGKVTLNVGAGKDQSRLEKGMVVLKTITGIDPVKTLTQLRVPSWGLRPGLPVGCKITLRKEKAREVLLRLLEAKDNKLKPSCFDNSGNVSFGIHEYIDIPGVKYDPKIGVMGLQVCITLERPGYRVKSRRIRPKRIGKDHVVSREDAIAFMQQEFGVKVGEKA